MVEATTRSNYSDTLFTNYKQPEAVQANMQAQLELSDLSRLLSKYPNPSKFMANLMAMKAERVAKLIKKTARDS